MTALNKVSELFIVKQGVNLALSDLEECKKSDKDSINFVSRTDNNNGISAFVKKAKGIIPNQANTISVAVGGSVLASFFQPEPYYSGFHLFALTPIRKMTPVEMIYYSICIRSNRYRYNYGRQANKTLKDILIPAEMPEAFSDISMDKINTINDKSVINNVFDLNIPHWKYHKLSDLFKIEGVKTISASKIDVIELGMYPYVTRSNVNNAVYGLYNYKTEGGNVLVVSALDGFCTYQPRDFSASMVKKLVPKFKLNKYVAMFLTRIINAERYRFNYGREAGSERLKQISINLPSKNDGTPDFEFMENYIKSLPYSSSL